MTIYYHSVEGYGDNFNRHVNHTHVTIQSHSAWFGVPVESTHWVRKYVSEYIVICFEQCRPIEIIIKMFGKLALEISIIQYWF